MESILCHKTLRSCCLCLTYVAQFGMLLLLLPVGRLMIYAAFRGQEPETAKTSGCFRKPVAISGPFVLQLLQLLQVAGGPHCITTRNFNFALEFLASSVHIIAGQVS